MEAGGFDAAGTAERLRAFIAARLTDAAQVQIGPLTPVAGGSSSENVLFDACWQQDGTAIRQPLVLRRSAANTIVVASRDHEFEVLTALKGTGVRAPRAFWLDRDGTCFGRPAMILERRAGRTERSLLQDRNSLGLDRPTRLGLAQDMVDTLAAIHALDANRLPDRERSDRAASPAAHECELQRTQAHREGLSQMPELALADAWLRANMPGPPARPVLVHGDFRPANVLVEGGRLSAVLDWELAHVGDPYEDLGWHLAPVYRHEHFIPGVWQPDDFLARYERSSGHSVDRKAVRFWSVFAMYKLVVIGFAAVRALTAGDHTRLAAPPYRLLGALMSAIADGDAT